MFHETNLTPIDRHRHPAFKGARVLIASSLLFCMTFSRANRSIVRTRIYLNARVCLQQKLFDTQGRDSRALPPPPPTPRAESPPCPPTRRPRHIRRGSRCLPKRNAFMQGKLNARSQPLRRKVVKRQHPAMCERDRLGYRQPQSEPRGFIHVAGLVPSHKWLDHLALLGFGDAGAVIV